LTAFNPKPPLLLLPLPLPLLLLLPRLPPLLLHSSLPLPVEEDLLDTLIPSADLFLSLAVD
jgi:hypothetical protein